MIGRDDEFAREFLAECRERLSGIQTDLLAIEKGEAAIDEELIHRVYWAVHSVKGAGFFGLVKIRDLAQQTEEVLALIRSGKMIPTKHRVRVLAGATDRLQNLIQNPAVSNHADIAELMWALSGFCADQLASATRERGTSARNQPQQDPRRLRVLLVEDDFVSRLLLQTFLARYGKCDYAANGREAVEAFRSASERGQRYDLVCLDLMMPEMDGREALRQVRALEKAHGVLSGGAKIIVTTTESDIKVVIRCFQELCDSYLIKPVDLAELRTLMTAYQLIP